MALPINPMDCLEQMHSQTPRYLVSSSQLTNEWQPKAQQCNIAIPMTTSPMETTKPTYLSPANVPQVPPSVWPPPKPLDLYNYQQNTPQPSNGPPRRVFNHSTNTLPSPTTTKHKCKNQVPTRTSTALAKQALELTQGPQPVLVNGPNNIKGKRLTSLPMPPLHTVMIEEKPTGLNYQLPATMMEGCFSL